MRSTPTASGGRAAHRTMSLIAELVGQFIMEFLAYGIGRVFVLVFLPWYGVEPLSRHDPREERGWKWRGFSYQEMGRRYLRIGTVQLIGLVILVALAAMVITLRGG
jgi:hypothetical protein